MKQPVNFFNYIIYSARLSVHEDVTPRGVNPPLELLLPLKLTLFVYRRRHRRRRLPRRCCRRRLSAPLSNVRRGLTTAVLLEMGMLAVGYRHALPMHTLCTHSGYIPCGCLGQAQPVAQGAPDCVQGSPGLTRIRLISEA
jgi:hypothetical protein